MTKQRSRRRVLKTGGLALAAGLAGCTGGSATTGTTAGGEATTVGDESTAGEGTGSGDLADSMVVFHAGSLAPPFSTVEEQFEGKYGVRAQCEAKGSVASTQKVTQQSRSTDVLGVSDFRLLRDRIVPEFGDWYGIFATNAMTIAYTEESAGASEIGRDNWWEILLREDVSFAHSDPAVDPNGYRSVMTMKLGATPFEGSRLYDGSTARQLIGKANVPSGTETKLMGQLQAGKLDYVFQYQSAGATRDIETVDLTPEVDLSKATQAYAEHYAKVEVETGSGTFTGAPIAYGVTVPSVADAPGRGARWVQFLITEPGEKVLRDSGFQPVQPAVVPTSGQDAVPKRVMNNAEAKDSLGPLEL
jgi:molybdate/tungstate transport system substrate-binding protein